MDDMAVLCMSEESLICNLAIVIWIDSWFLDPLSQPLIFVNDVVCFPSLLFHKNRNRSLD